MSLSFLTVPLPPRSTLFPYTTLFRSDLAHAVVVTLDRPIRVFVLQLHLHEKTVAKRKERSPQPRLHESLDRPDVALLFFLARSEEHTSELQSRLHLVCRLLLEKKKFE